MKDGTHPPSAPHRPQPSSPPTVQRARSLGRSLPPPVDWAWTAVRVQGRVAVLGFCRREPRPASGWGCFQQAPPARPGQGRAFGARAVSPTPPSLTARGPLPHPQVEGGVPRGYSLKPGKHPSCREPSPTQASGSEAAAWSLAKSSSSPLSRRSRNSAACSSTWILLATGSMSATGGGGWA